MGEDDAYSGYFLQLNMGKQGLSVNTKDPRGKALMHKLVDSADVFIENYRPGALDKIGPGLCRAEPAQPRPGVLLLHLGLRPHRPDAHRAGFGLIAEAKSGIMQMVGTPGEAPPLLRISLGDMYTGIHAVAAINAALLGRVKSGRGQHIDMALYDTLVSMHENAVQCYTLSGGKVLPSRPGTTCPPPRSTAVFRAADGDLVIAAQVDDAWKRFAAMVEAHGGPAGFGGGCRFHTSTGRNTHRLEILSVVQPWVAARQVAAVLALLDGIDVPCAKVQRIDEVLPTRRSRRAAWWWSRTIPCSARSNCPTCPSGSRMRHHHPPGRAGPGPAQRGDRRGAGLQHRRDRADAADGVLYTKEMK